MNKLGDLSCNEFLTELASAAPAPGGAAALQWPELWRRRLLLWLLI